MTYWNGYQWVPDAPRASAHPPRGRDRLIGASIEALLVVLLTFGLVAGTTLAAKGDGPQKGPGRNSVSTMELQMVLDGNADGAPNHLDEITFAVTTSATDTPMVGLRCWQGSAFVHDGYIALYEASWLVKYFRLDSSYWDAAQPATCAARLFYYDNRSRERVLATMDFVAQP